MNFALTSTHPSTYPGVRPNTRFHNYAAHMIQQEPELKQPKPSLRAPHKDSLHTDEDLSLKHVVEESLVLPTVEVADVSESLTASSAMITASSSDATASPKSPASESLISMTQVTIPPEEPEVAEAEEMDAASEMVAPSKAQTPASIITSAQASSTEEVHEGAPEQRAAAIPSTDSNQDKSEDSASISVARSQAPSGQSFSASEERTEAPSAFPLTDSEARATEVSPDAPSSSSEVARQQRKAKEATSMDAAASMLADSLMIVVHHPH